MVKLAPQLARQQRRSARPHHQLQMQDRDRLGRSGSGMTRFGGTMRDAAMAAGGTRA
jgi:hypothetical protein